jgi:NAD(P)-dependent dehydrogenase (short-subunit alcohol dehydrogenase family)
MLGLEGKRVLVTGASLGIGAAAATLFARLGAHVAVAYRSSENEAARVVEQARAAGGSGVQVHAFAADLSRWDEGERLVAEVETRLGPIDVAVLNHGIWKEAAIDAMRAADYDETLDANVRGEGATFVTGEIFNVNGGAVLVG